MNNFTRDFAMALGGFGLGAFLTIVAVALLRIVESAKPRSPYEDTELGSDGW